MKLQSKSYDQEDGHVTVIAEEAEDLWHLYNLVCQGDAVKPASFPSQCFVNVYISGWIRSSPRFV